MTILWYITQLPGLLCCGVPGTKRRGSRKYWKQLLALPGWNTVKLSRIEMFFCLFSFVEKAYFQAVSDIERAVLNILQFVVVDFIGIIISAGLCYKVLCCFPLLLWFVIAGCRLSLWTLSGASSLIVIMDFFGIIISANHCQKDLYVFKTSLLLWLLFL